MQGNWVREEAYYRCRYPAQYAIATKTRHPKSVYLREADLLPHLDGWIAELFDPARPRHHLRPTRQLHQQRRRQQRGGQGTPCHP
jgi:hypothetical protein